MRIVLSLFMALFATLVARAGVKMTNMNWVAEGQKGRIIIALDAPYASTPDWDIQGGKLILKLPGVEIAKNMDRKIGNAQLVATHSEGATTVGFNFINGAIKGDSVDLTLRDGKIEISLAVPAVKPQTAAAQAVTPKLAKAMGKGQLLGEDFLKKIEAEVNAPKIDPKTVIEVKQTESPKTDIIKSAEAAPRREDGFSFVGYAGKFIAFLGFVLLFFWGIIQLMKKGVLSKGKLGFLNNTQLVTVLSTTYVAPKRAILLVKAHNQAFLVSSSESGMSFIAEVKDVPGLVKEGERELMKTNFDDNFKTAEESPQDVKVKEDIYQSTPVEDKGSMQKDIVRFSDELKKKVKNLKSLQ